MVERRVLKDTEPYITSYPRTIGVADYLGGRIWDFSRPPIGDVSEVFVRINTPGEVADEDSWVEADTWDTLSQAVSQTVYEGDTSITTDGGTFERGGLYWVMQVGAQNAKSSAEHLVECSDGAENLLNIKEPIPFDVDIGALVFGFHVRHQLSLDQTAEVGSGSIEWKVILNGSTHIWTEAIRIVRSLPYTTLTPTRLTAAYPAIRNLKPASDVDYEEVIASAYTHEIVPWLSASGVNDEDVVSVEALEPVHAIACMVHLARQREGISDELYQRLYDRFEQLKNTTLGRKDWYLRSQISDVPEDRSATRPTSNTILLRR